MEEIWKDIEGYEGLYQVSNWGRVKRLGHYKEFGKVWVEKIHYLKPRSPKGSHGYCYITLCKNGIKNKQYLHRVVAKAFLPNDDNSLTINHKDENKKNNHIDNLEWCSQKYNVQYSNCGKHWFNDGEVNVFKKECPEGFTKGRIISWSTNKRGEVDEIK